MNSVPAELLYALIFGAMLLLQHLMKRFGGPSKPADALQEAPDPEQFAPERERPVSSQWGRVPEVPAVLLGAAEWDARLQAPAARAVVARRRPASRSLLGGGQNLRHVIVGMTLLGPCRGQEPHENR